jgi:3-oxoacyl-[acyl-carrier protein] reductase
MSRIVLVTGASSGYGKAIAKAFKESGDTVIMTARGAQKLEAARLEVGGDDAVAMDVTVTSDWKKIIEFIRK